MDSNRKIAVIAGILFIVATVADVVGTQLSSPDLNDANYLSRISVNANVVLSGALLELIAAGACAGIAISLYPVLRRWNTGLALGSVAFRTIEAVMYVVGVVSLLSLLTLSEQFTKTTGSDLASLQAAGYALLAIRQQTTIPAVLAFSVGALMYYYLFYRSDLVPRWMSGWGIVAIILTMAACLLAWFNRTPMPGPYTILILPIAVQEMVLALWLILKGFSSPALASGFVTRDSLASAEPTSATAVTAGATS
jgi:hypothetical protein